MPKGVYPRKQRKKRHYRKGRVVDFDPSKRVTQEINGPQVKTLWDVVSSWSPNRLKAILERIPLD